MRVVPPARTGGRRRLELAGVRRPVPAEDGWIVKEREKEESEAWYPDSAWEWRYEPGVVRLEHRRTSVVEEVDRGRSMRVTVAEDGSVRRRKARTSGEAKGRRETARTACDGCGRVHPGPRCKGEDERRVKVTVTLHPTVLRRLDGWAEREGIGRREALERVVREHLG